MCIACLLPKGTKISEKEFENCWDSNPDGGGFCYLDEQGKFIVRKSLKLDEFKELWKEHSPQLEHSPFLLHFRIRSQGDISIDNCHPFKINPDAMMIHNGNITETGAGGKEPKSDSALFAEWLGGLPRNFYRNAATVRLIKSHIGMTNKIVLLDKTGDYLILNRTQGFESDGRWFSNNAFKYERTIPATNFNKGNSKGNSSTHLTPSNNYRSIVTKHWHECAWCLRWVQRGPDWEFSPDRCKVCWDYCKRVQQKLDISEQKAKVLLNKLFATHNAAVFEERERAERDIERAARQERERETKPFLANQTALLPQPTATPKKSGLHSVEAWAGKQFHNGEVPHWVDSEGKPYSFAGIFGGFLG